MKYELIATLGPSSDSPALWEAMSASGVTAFRLNTSHLSLEQLSGWMQRLDDFGAGRRLPLVLDLQGSKWRLGELDALELAVGQPVELVYAAAGAAPGVLPVPHADFFRAAPLSNGEIVLNDAKVRLALEASGPDWVRARVCQGGPLSAHKGITFAACEYRSEALSEKDRAIFEQTRNFAGVRYAISYVKDALEMAHYRSWFGAGTFLAAKLERGPAMAEAAQLAAAADELWVCRGDLGAELGLKGMAEAVARLSATLDALPVRVIMAGQVLEHMTQQPVPTRSEVCYLYDCLRLGYGGFVLSDEAAIGRYPLESCRTAALFRE